MISEIIIMAVILIITLLAKKKFISVIGLVGDVFILFYRLKWMYELSADKSAGNALAIVVVGPMMIMLLLAMVGLTIWQSTTIRKFEMKK